MIETPTGQTENQIHGIQGDLNALDKVLGRQGHSGFSASISALWLLTRVEGKADVSGKVYFDRGREYIQYADDIRVGLRKQFGKRFLKEVKRRFPDFYRKLEGFRNLQMEIEYDDRPAPEFSQENALRFSLMPVRTIYFSGMSDGIEEERGALADHIRAYNTDGLMPDRMLVLPVFAKYDTRGGLLTDNAINRILNSSMYVEIVGDGFGDTSYIMADNSYITAKAKGIPALIMVKKQRTAKNLDYAKQFLAGVNPEDVVYYETTYDIVDLFHGRYQRTFTGKYPYSNKHERWRQEREAFLSQSPV